MQMKLIIDAELVNVKKIAVRRWKSRSSSKVTASWKNDFTSFVELLMFPYTLFSANIVVVLIFVSTWGIDVASVLRWQLIALFLSNFQKLGPNQLRLMHQALPLYWRNLQNHRRFHISRLTPMKTKKLKTRLDKCFFFRRCDLLRVLRSLRASSFSKEEWAWRF